VSLPISSNPSLRSIADIHLRCQYPVQQLDKDGEEEPSGNDLNSSSSGVEILNDYSIAFQRFLNGFRFHHLTNQIKEKEGLSASDHLLRVEEIKTPPEDEEEAVSHPAPCPLVSSQTLIEYIHRFGASFQENASGDTSPPPGYTFGYHGTNYLPHLQSILTQGFNPLLRNAQLFGPGEYFARSGYEECAAIYSGRTNMLLVSGLILSDELSPPVPTPPVPVATPPADSSPSASSSPPSPSSPSFSSVPFTPSPFFVLPNPNPKAYGVTGRYQFVHDYFSYSMPLLLVHWNPVVGAAPAEEEEAEEDWMFDYNHHKDPKELESLPSLQSPSLRSQGGGGGGDSESGIWTNKSFLTEEGASQYLESGGGDSLPYPTGPSGITSLPPNGPSAESPAAAAPAGGPHSQRRIITASNSYQFNDSDEEGQGEGEGREEKASTSSYSPPLPPPLHPHPPRLQAHQRHQMESFSTTTTSFAGPRYSRSFTAQEDEEEEEKRYALLKLKSLMKKQESFLEEDHLHPQRLERVHSNAWFDSIF
jgi:hypothetical protein